MCDSSNGREPEARWANQFNSGYRPCVIELVFYQNSDREDDKRILSHIITSPDDAKAILRNLAETIEKYEEKFGTIPEKDCSKPNNAIGKAD